MRLESYGTSDAGPYRKRNEDAFLVVPEKGLFAVADGMGGHHGGDLASAKAVSSLKKLLFEDIPASDALLDKFLASKVKQINSEMYSPQAGMAHNEKMGTTLVSLWFLGGKALISNVGDSRCYHWKAVDGSLTQVTEDHNLFEQVRRVEPDVSSQQYANLSSALTKVIGINAELEPDLHLIPAAPNDVFFLCTDGISKELGFDEINSVLAEKSSASAKEIGEALMKMAADKHPKDNYTSVVVKVISLDEGAGRFSSSVTANRKNRKALYFFLFILLGVAVVAFLIWKKSRIELPPLKAAVLAYETGDFSKAVSLFEQLSAEQGAEYSKLAVSLARFCAKALDAKSDPDELAAEAEALVDVATKGGAQLLAPGFAPVSVPPAATDVLRLAAEKMWTEELEPSLKAAISAIRDRQLQLKLDIRLQEAKKAYVSRLDAKTALQALDEIRASLPLDSAEVP